MLHRAMVRRARFLAVLDTMWGDEGNAPRWFAINPYNWSGKRLYRITGTVYPRLWVTNSCPAQVASPSGRGVPDPKWLRESLEMLSAGLMTLPLLVCGGTAQRTFAASGYTHCGPVYLMKHPAARSWTREEIETTTNLVTR